MTIFKAFTWHHAKVEDHKTSISAVSRLGCNSSWRAVYSTGLGGCYTVAHAEIENVINGGHVYDPVRHAALL